jgi:hypothetical protein
MKWVKGSSFSEGESEEEARERLAAVRGEGESRRGPLARRDEEEAKEEDVRGDGEEDEDLGLFEGVEMVLWAAAEE